MIDVVRGVLRVRKWPRKRGKPKSASQLFWIDWFKQANLLAKYADPMTQARSKELTAHTGMYPRDIILAAIRGRLYTWVDENGWRWYPVAAIQDISESLDVLAQTVGSMLIRYADRWKALDPGLEDEVLTLKGTPLIAQWRPPAGGGGGFTQEVLFGSPFTPDGSASFMDFDVEGYAQIQFDVKDLDFDASDKPVFRLSIDGGVTFKEGASDYTTGYVTPSADAWVDQNRIFTTFSNLTSGGAISCLFNNIGAGRCTYQLIASNSAAVAIWRGGMFNFDGPVTHIRLMTRDGAKLDDGTIRLVGIK